MKKNKITEMPSPPDSNCAVCMSASRAALSAMRDLGASVEEISEAGRLPSEVIEKHFAECVPPITGGEESDTQLAQLLRDSTELYYGAVIGGAWPAASSALAVRLRALSELSRRTELRTKHGSLLDGSDPRSFPNSWQQPDLAAFVQAHLDWLIEQAVECEATTC